MCVYVNRGVVIDANVYIITNSLITPYIYKIYELLSTINDYINEILYY